MLPHLRGRRSRFAPDDTFLTGTPRCGGGYARGEWPQGRRLSSASHHATHLHPPPLSSLIEMPRCEQRQMRSSASAWPCNQTGEIGAASNPSRRGGTGGFASSDPQPPRRFDLRLAGQAGHRKLVIHLQGRRLLVVKFIEFDVRQEHRTLRGDGGLLPDQG